MSETFFGEILITNAENGSVRVRIDGPGGNLWLGGNGGDGDLVLFKTDGDNKTLSKATIHLDGQGGNIWAGGNGTDGDLVLHPAGTTDITKLDQAGIHLDAGGTQIVLKVGGKARLRIEGGQGNIWAGGNGADGDLVLFKSDGDNKTLSKATIHLDGQGGNIWAGGNGTDGDVVLFPSSATDLTDLSQASIHLDGQAGDIKLAGADCAEHFVVADPTRAIAGTVLVVEDESTLAPCADAYDSRVAGVVSGAGDYRPGVVLGTGATSGSSVPIALAGRVYCQVDADFAPICVGDLLTTSTRQGHAMKATDREAGFGSVLGKALRPLRSGQDLIPVLVSLQ